MPDAVLSNIGRLLPATKFYYMHSVATHVSIDMMVVLPGPEEDHIPETKASLALMHMG